ncbi:MAG: hypothetical protein IJ645_10670 [Ruminococcus sp.]|nr:hypothetical protein [Ruminococcus sp.]
MKQIKFLTKAAALVLSAGVLISALPMSAIADEAEPVKALTGTFTYVTMGSENALGEEYEQTDKFYYSDDFFSEPSSVMNEHLRTISADLALAAFGSLGEDNSANAVDLLTKLEYDPEVDVQDVEGEPTKDTIGSYITYTITAEDKNIIAVALRGSRYGAEWANTLRPGTEGDLEGLTEASQKIVERIKAFCESREITADKIWITGYSRSGAVADLTGKYINEHLDEFGITADDLYVYTFEAPRASAENTQYANIHDVINPNDIIPMVYPEQWGIYHAGVEEYLNCEDKTVQPMQIDAAGLASGKFSFLPIETRTEPEAMKDFEKSFIDFLTQSMDRDSYSQRSEAIGDIVVMALGLSKEQMSALGDFAKSAFSNIGLMDLAMNVLPVIAGDPTSADYPTAVDNLAQFVISKFDAADHSACLTDEQYAALKAALPGLLHLVAPVVSRDATAKHGGEVLEMISTFAGNARNIIREHIPENVLEMVKAEDSYYTDNVQVERGNAFYFGVVSAEDKADDDKLREIGFDDTDIEFLKNGYDVYYSVFGRTISKDDPDDDAYSEQVQAALDEYCKGKNIDINHEFSVLGESWAIRNRGYEPIEAVDIENIVVEYMAGAYDVDASLYKDLLEKGTFHYLYFDPETNAFKESTITDMRIEFPDSDTVELYFNAQFYKAGVYALLYEPNEEIVPSDESSEPVKEESSKADESSKAAEESSTAAKAVSTESSSNPGTGAPVVMSVVILAAAAAVITKKSK